MLFAYVTVDTSRNDYVMITSKRRPDVIIAPYVCWEYPTYLYHYACELALWCVVAPAQCRRYLLNQVSFPQRQQWFKSPTGDLNILMIGTADARLCITPILSSCPQRKGTYAAVLSHRERAKWLLCLETINEFLFTILTAWLTVHQAWPLVSLS